MEEQKTRKYIRQKINSKMADINSFLSVVILNVHEINTSTEHSIGRMILKKNMIHPICCLQETL